VSASGAVVSQEPSGLPKAGVVVGFLKQIRTKCCILKIEKKMEKLVEGNWLYIVRSECGNCHPVNLKEDLAKKNKIKIRAQGTTDGELTVKKKDS
jgi:hypothetical protein